MNTLSLLELNNLVRHRLRTAFPSTYWVRAEMTDVRINASSGHCYMELVEKSEDGRSIVAKTRASIWNSTLRTLKPYFEKETGQKFTSGLKVLLKISIEMHPLYGYSFTVQGIDPTFTVGDMVKRRLEIINRLKKEGIYDMNHQLSFPLLLRRIAVISSETAAGYEDFYDQLSNNPSKYPFYLKLFPAYMQGERTEDSIIAALDRIYNHAEHFDAVVIIRGGGSTSDLNCFDSYALASSCAQFPLPIITGIGHERDDTIIDLVAKARLKTPTAVAEFLIQRVDALAIDMQTLQQKLFDSTQTLVLRHKQMISTLSSKVPVATIDLLERYKNLLRNQSAKLPNLSQQIINKQLMLIDNIDLRIRSASSNWLNKLMQEIKLKEQFITMASPEYVLARGYSLVQKNGKIIKHAAELKPGDKLSTRFSDGEVVSIVENSQKPPQKGTSN